MVQPKQCEMARLNFTTRVFPALTAKSVKCSATRSNKNCKIVANQTVLLFNLLFSVWHTVLKAKGARLFISSHCQGSVHVWRYSRPFSYGHRNTGSSVLQIVHLDRERLQFS